jgi:hypothetical protein
MWFSVEINGNCDLFSALIFHFVVNRQAAKICRPRNSSFEDCCLLEHDIYPADRGTVNANGSDMSQEAVIK